MLKLVFWLNAVLLLPFGLAAIIAPEFVFSNFGMTIDAAGAGIARGYASLALGLGVIFLLLRNAIGRAVTVPLLLGSLVFNGAEVLVQVPIYFQGLANGMIWSTILGHCLGLVLSALALRDEARG